MRKTLIAAVAAGAMMVAATPAVAAPTSSVAATNGVSANIVDVVLAVSGDEGFDNRSRDFDILREALVATDLAGAVASTEDITVFAPNDRAFKRLARQLGWDGSGGEEGAFGVIASVGLDTVSDVLRYHVGTERLSLRDLFRSQNVTTLLGPDVKVKRFRVIDADTDDRNPRVTFPWYVPASNGSIVVIDDVLRPFDLP